VQPVEIKRPDYGSVSLRDALAADWRGWHLSEKKDGCFAFRNYAGCTVAGEAMRDGRFFAFDIPVAFGEDVRKLPWTERSAALDDLFFRLNPKLNWHRCATGHGSEFIESVLAAGGEGVVSKPWDAPFGRNLFKVKRVQTFDVIITEPPETRLSIGIGEFREGVLVDAGRVPIRSLRILEHLQVGDVIEIAAQCRTVKGKFREPHFVRVRADKSNPSL
jgi:hypothetical protein